MQANYFPVIYKKTTAKFNVFAFPYAGIGASLYKIDEASIPDNIALIPVQLPGREERILENPFTNMSWLVNKLASEIQSHLDKPFVFFGHCLGALIAFELAHVLKDQYSFELSHFFVSACPAPHIHKVDNPKHKLPAEQFLEEVQNIGSFEKPATVEKKVTNILLPGLKADFSLYENYQYAAKEKLSCPITVFHGVEDHYIPVDLLLAWEEQTDEGFFQQSFAGNHLYIHNNLKAVLEIIDSQLLKNHQQMGAV
jgi:medium-chain acyl-[acyl-carrier-protein] hydrolase